MMIKGVKIYLSLCILLISLVVNAQSDSLTLSYKEYINMISQHHPLAKKANLKLDFAKAEWMSAKGNLDPVITSGLNQKKFNDKLYYRKLQGNLKIPTRLGIDIVGGYENSEGIYLNPEHKTDEFGLWHFGVEMNVLQGLIVNERRVAIQKAKIVRKLSENERQLMLNELYYSATVTYLKWQQYYFYKKIISENINIAKTYHENTKQSYLGGEKTSIDTLEAYMIHQDALMLFQKNEISLIKAKQNIENYLWDNENPVDLNPVAEPENFSNPIFEIQSDLTVTNLVDNHPIILASVNKQSNLELDQKLKREKLKPKLKLKYNPLLSTNGNEFSATYSRDNFKWGFEFSMPLFLRSERASVRKGKIKIEETTLDIETKRTNLKNKLEGSQQQLVLLREQLVLLEKNVKGYKILLDGENEKFKYGESSVFLLNKRQEKYINGQLKLVGLNTKLHVELSNYLYYSNGLIEKTE